MRKAITFSLLLLFFTLRSVSQPGSFNTSFGSSGFVTISFGDLEDYGYAMAIQSDGKIIATGSFLSSTTDYTFCLARLNSDGSLDNSFGSGGKVVTPIGISASEIFAVAIQSDGKIIAAGYSTQDFDLSDDFTLVRYNADGSLDNSFGTGGIVVTDLNISEDMIYTIAIQPDGKILAAGPTHTLTAPQVWSFGIARYNADGSLDDSFGNSGKVITPISGYQNDAYKVLITSDNKIIVAGRNISIAGTSIAIVKYNSDGSLDNSFGSSGIVTQSINNFIAATALLQRDGRIVVASSMNVNGTSDFALARFNSNGTIDNSFGNGGVVSTHTGDYGEILSLTIQSDGKIIAVGHSFEDNFQTGKITLARYNTDGSLDSSFGDNGITKTSIGVNDLGYDIKLYDNKIFIVGSTIDADGGIDMLVSSFNNDGFPPSNCNFQVSIPDVSALPHGVEPNTVYLGYSPAASITLSGNVSGAGTYTYLWSNNSTSQSISVSPVSETIYSVTVTDQNSCVQTASKTISVIDVDCGNGKVKICHLSNDPNHLIDICVGESAVASHLAQGCSLGDCSTSIAAQRIVLETEQPNVFELKLYPNPSRNVFTIIAQTGNVNDKIEMRIIDVSGRVVEMNKNIKPNQSFSVGENLAAGIYFVELRQRNNLLMKKLLKL